MGSIFKFLLFGLLFSTLFQSCKDTSPPTFSPSDEDEQIDLSNPLERLPGDNEENILNATFDFSYPSEATHDEVSTIVTDGVSQRIIRTEIELSLTKDATVRQVNELLDKYDAKIVDMLKGVNSLIILIDDPGDVESLNSEINLIESENIVEFILESVLIEDPTFIEGSVRNRQKTPDHINDLYRIDHQLAIRAHGAWNLSRAIAELDERPWFVIADFFGDGPPNIGYGAEFNSADFSTGNSHLHGYHVLGIVLGRYSQLNELNQDQNDVTGIFPKRINVRAYDLRSSSLPNWNRTMNRIIKLIRDIRTDSPNARIILNTSLNSTGALLSNNYHAYKWIEKVRGTSNRESLEDNFIHFTSAGNKGENEERYPAKDNSMFALAGLEDVTTDLFFTREKLTNTFVVENRVHSKEGQNTRSKPGCTNDNSIIGGNLSGIGTNVYSFGACLQAGSDDSCLQYGADSYTSFLTGTSMSTPQAAGVAAYVWAVNPELSVTQVMDIIKKTTDERSVTPTVDEWFNCNITAPRPIIDAYAAVLAAGGENARKVLLDVNEDGIFDEEDIDIYTSQLVTRNGSLDYSRYDLNGSGRTGGSDTERFDLNNNMSYENLTKAVEETDIEFDESSITDQEILCYYAYSNLFEGNSDDRGELLNGLCSSVQPTFSVPTISTTAISNITSTSAQSGGNVSDDGGAFVTKRGVCWSTSQNPAMNDDCTSEGTGVGGFTSDLSGLSAGTEYFVRAYAINEQGTGYGNEKTFTTDSESDEDEWPRDTETEVVEVTNHKTGRTWMDRNLGANRVATSSTDAEAYGDLYQWGRAADGHENRNSAITTNLSDSDQPGHGLFIKNISNILFDWRSPQNNNLWQGVTGINNPCPSGYRLPTESEWEAERQSWSTHDAAGAFASQLKLPLAGYRFESTGSIQDVGSRGGYWSSGISGGAGARFLEFAGSFAVMNSFYRSGGQSVRCIKEMETSN